MIITIISVVIGNIIYSFCFSWITRRIMKDNIVNVSVTPKTFKERLKEKENESRID
jgi:hypothetical protein